MDGPEHLQQFEDRLLYHLVELTGDRPLPAGQGVSESDLAALVASELNIEAGFAQDEEFSSSQARLIVLKGIENLEDEGLVDALKTLGRWTISPTRNGRRKVNQWRQEWQKVTDRAVQQQILEELERCWRADPNKYMYSSQVDVKQLCADLNVRPNDYLSNAQRLVGQHLISEVSIDQFTLAEGHAYITEAGRRRLEISTADDRPTRDLQEAWVEVARLRRRLELAERSLPSLVSDEELRRRCNDLLTADGHYDRAIREACVILENRVRILGGFDASLVGTGLMEKAFSQKSPVFRLSEHEQEQRGAMELYRGVMAFYRNAAGHHIMETYSHDDALRFVVQIDLLLSMLQTVQPARPQAEVREKEVVRN